MHNINILEQKLLKYRIKKYAIYISFLFGSAALFFIFMLYIDKSKKNEQLLSGKQKLKLSINANINTIEPYLTNSQLKNHMLTTPPNIKKQSEQIIDQINNIHPVNQTFSNEDTLNDQTKSTQSIATVNNNEEDYAPQKQKTKVNLAQESNVATLIDIMKRFNESHDPNDSLFLAISYYEKKEYNKALFWAIETNKITEEIEDSWIIMAKSKFYLGDKNEAIRILRAYASKTGSKEALNIINEFENENK
jgi:hypothetical protein